MTASRATIDLVELGGDPGPFSIGSKASGLIPLARAGLPVPPGAVVPAEAIEADIDRLAATVARRFAGASLAVRSSGVAEDLDTASFAGQYATVLDVPDDPAEIAAAIRTVRDSASGPRVDVYASDRNRAMAVLVMPMIDATAAGIAFTRDPITGADRVVVEAVAGLGHRLASGEEAGELWTINDEAVCRQDLGVLTAEQAGEIAALARRCEEIAGAPQDIEWAFDGAALRLLQSRRITTHDVEPITINDAIPPGPWEWDSTHNRIPMTPLTASVFTPGFEDGSRRLVQHYGIPFDHLAMRTINGYLYIQVVPPIGKPGLPPPPAAIMRLMFRIIPSLRRREKTARNAFAHRTDRKLVAEWRDKMRPAIERELHDWYDLDMTALSDVELWDHLQQAAREQNHTFAWNMATDPGYLLPLADLLEFVGAAGLGGMETVTRLVAGSSRAEYRDSIAGLAQLLTPAVRDVITSGGTDVLDRLATADSTFARAYESHQREHGQRILGFDLLDPTMLEDPAAELARLVTLPADIDPTPDAEALAAELRSRLDSVAAQRFDALLGEARSTYPIREEGEAVHARVMGALRLFALEVGRRMVASGRLSDPAHVFFLQLDEVGTWLSEGADVSAVARMRRGQRQWALGQTPQPSYGGNHAMPELDAFPPNVARWMGMMNLVIAHDQRPSDIPDGTDGVAASPGHYTGPARIVRGPSDFGRVEVGDVLIAPITTSPWEVVFPHIGALVTEGGGLLSHPAIVAREYRLPAVVGCEGAMTRFYDGQLVTVNGTNGTVRAVEVA